MSQMPLARIEHDTDALSRHDPELLGRLSRFILVRDGQVAIESGALVSVTPRDVPGELLSWDHLSYLGRNDGEHWAALHLDATEFKLDPEGMPYGDRRVTALHYREFVSLRKIGHELSGLEAGLATAATALGAWRDYRTHCPSCGGVLSPRAAGWEGECRDCDLVLYPRTDPSVIMAIRDSRDRLLLGHASNWEPTRYSCLAGFVEAGESLEHAVVRESFEEAGVEITRVEYFGSQPWPFPRSLMAAFRAWTDSELVEVDGEEITNARFFTRDDLRDEIESNRLTVPMASSVARYLIEDWYGGPLPVPPGGD
ncbi:NAD(+) diphosphatase [Flaviflexus huanghaiensis]|uniref:NAD(+) diphosphatase n=1 Tax=Flaviflexus huanghaiensis TaxID=1111473 RepID=UPI0015FE4CA3|nr:NAD(+) diphosphatase [Flaviflexus huanghaiensis]